MIAAGGTLKDAAAAAGVGRSTLHHWYALGDPARRRPEHQAHREFRAALDEARVAAAQARASEAGDWRAAAWLLEQADPARWGPPALRLGAHRRC